MKITAKRILPAIAAISLASSLALTGCSLVPHIPNLGGGGGGVSTNPGQNGTKVVTLPAGFPSDIPLVNNNYAYAVSVSATAWGVFVKVDDAIADFNKASDLLTSAGFTKSADVGGSSGGGSLGLFTSDTYTIQMTSAPKSEWGPVVEYVITKKS